MKTRIILLVLSAFCLLGNASAKKRAEQPVNDRKQWADLCYSIEIGRAHV